MKILVNIEGGIGKNVAATGAVKVAKDAGHEVDVLTAWPQVWLGNPNVNKVLDFGGLRYFTDELKGYDKLISMILTENKISFRIKPISQQRSTY